MTHRLKERIDQLRQVTGASRNCSWMVDEVCSLLYSLVKFYQPDLVIQTGHLWGKSALFVLEAIRDGCGIFEDPRLNPDRHFAGFVEAHRPRPIVPLFYSVDPNPQGAEDGNAGISLLADWYAGTFAFFRIKSQDFFAQEGAGIDAQFAGKLVMTIVDGDHTEAGCNADLVGSASIGASLIFVDDIDLQPKIAAIAIAFANQYGYLYFPLHLYNGVAILASKEA